jgi:hypothetical protein
MKRKLPGNEIYANWLSAKRLDPNLTSAQYLDIIAPSQKPRSENTAARTLRKLRSGESSGARLYARSFKEVREERASANIVWNYDGKFSTVSVAIPKDAGRMGLFRRSKRDPKTTYVRNLSEFVIELQYKETLPGYATMHRARGK